jgi:hypothetical protein
MNGAAITASTDTRQLDGQATLMSMTENITTDPDFASMFLTSF